MRSVSATLIGLLALAVSSASASGSSSAIPKPLEVYHAYYHNGQGGQILSLLVSDPRTSTQTGCLVTAPSAGGWVCRLNHVHKFLSPHRTNDVSVGMR